MIQYAIDWWHQPLGFVIGTGAIAWIAMSFITRFVVFCTYLVERYFHSRANDYQIEIHHISRYPTSDLDWTDMLFLWPLVVIIQIPCSVYNACTSLWRAVFTERGSNLRLIPKWFSAEGLVKLMNSGRKRNG